MGEITEFVVFLFSLLFAFRLFKYSLIKSGMYINDAFVIAWALAGIIGLYGFGNNVGLIIMFIGLFVVTFLTTVFMTYSAGLAAGALMKRNVFGAIPFVILLISPVAITFFEPWIGASIYSAIMFAILIYDYRDRYSYVRETFWENPMLSYIWIWPPLVFIVSVFDIVVIQDYLKQTMVIIISLFLVIWGTVTGYRNSDEY